MTNLGQKKKNPKKTKKNQKSRKNLKSQSFFGCHVVVFVFLKIVDVQNLSKRRVFSYEKQ